MNDFDKHIQNIKLSISRVNQYEKEEKNKDINYHINKLPNELINYIYFYLSFMPFDKKEFETYYNKNVLKYSFYSQANMAYYSQANMAYYSQEYFGYNYKSFNQTYLVGIVKTSKNFHNYDLRVIDNVFEYDYYSSKSKKYKDGRICRYNNRKRLMYLILNQYLSKDEFKRRINLISKEDLVSLIGQTPNLSTQFKSRFKVEDMNILLKRYTYKYY